MNSGSRVLSSLVIGLVLAFPFSALAQETTLFTNVQIFDGISEEYLDS